MPEPAIFFAAKFRRSVFTAKGHLEVWENPVVA